MKRLNLPWLLFFLVVVAQLSAQEKTDFQEFSMRDRFSFKTAAEMYTVADTLPYSAKVDAMIEEITLDIKSGTLIEHNKVWTKLQKLEPYRMHPKVQDAAKKWVDMTVANVYEKDFKEIPIKTLKNICSYYIAGNFARTEQESLKELLKDPASPDLRNNLALALLHQNKDLCAQIELEVLLKLFDSYPAGLINLVVVYERMNKNNEIDALVNKLHSLQTSNNMDIPEARFNAAWLMNKNGDYEGAAYILENPKPLQNASVAKYDSLRILNRKQLDRAK
ncbi:MAG: HrpB1 family type III secretion system apparatus protein [Prolixibacteraceae bacterium]|nr:HrpB1 family type III secretion system apparatus protein [Prolixibacteraceae bacterium]